MLLLLSFLAFLASLTLASPAPEAVTTVTTVVTTITEAPSIPSAVPQFTNPALFTSVILNSTNFFRTAHNATPVSYNTTLAAFAQTYLDDDVNTSSSSTTDDNNSTECAFAHSGGPYGENIAIGCSDAAGCVEAWGDEGSEYNFANPGFSEQTGHFTQLVWKDTTAVGCGSRLCGEQRWYLVCEYWPRGNVIGEFAQEVQSAGAKDRVPGRWRWLLSLFLFWGLWELWELWVVVV